jgi:radical SAM protein with 4Fe4S-binding SPASM domain
VFFKPGLRANPPRFVSIEPSSKCNLHCIMCSRETLVQKPLNSNMSLEAFRRIVDQFSDPEDVVLCGVGEPLMNPRLVEMVQHITDRGWSASLINNGTLMTGAKAHELIEAGLRKVTFSIHGGTPDTHQLIRQGSPRVDGLDKLYENIRRFVAIRDERHASVSVIANYLAARQTVSEFPETLRKAKAMGIDEVVALRLINVDGTLEHLAPTPEQEREMVGFKKLARELGMKFSFWEGAGMCRELWECIFVMSNGDVGPCDGWLYGKPSMGNLLEENLNDLWNGPKYLQLRRTFLDRKLEWCKTCCLGGAFETPFELVVDKVRRRASGLLRAK